MSLYAIRYNKAGQLVYSTDHPNTKDALIILEVPHTDNTLAAALKIPRPTAYNILSRLVERRIVVWVHGSFPREYKLRGRIATYEITGTNLRTDYHLTIDLPDDGAAKPAAHICKSYYGRLKTLKT